MSLKEGTRVGPYEIGALLGEGGMGQVYRARDTRLDRFVALKVSKADFTERFEREARAVAAINHPNICTLYDVGPNYLVMELVEGEPLKGPLPVAKAVEYAGQILDALDAAHKKGITHRDLKPANILVTRQGIKLLDFGLAKSSAPLAGTEETKAALTGAGQIVGTLQYMSPEQLQGREADARSDIFSFGCVLYELLSGTRAFDGSSPASVIAAVLEREPAPLVTTPPLDRVIRTCLEKDAEHRFQNAIDLKRALLWAVEAGAPPPTAAKVTTRSRWWLPAVAVVCLGLGFVAFPALTPELPESPDLRLTPFATGADAEGEPRWSPDGKSLVYVQAIEGQARLVARALDGSPPVVLSPPECGATKPFWSPDGREVYFVCPSGGTRENRLMVVPSVGGEPRQLFEHIGGADISPDGKTLVAFQTPGTRLSVSSPVGSALQPFPQNPFGSAALGARATVRYSRDGKFIYTNGGWVFDAAGANAPRNLQLLGEVFHDGAWTPNSESLVVAMPSSDGVPSGLGVFNLLTGAFRRVLTSPSSEFRSPDVSPDGTRVAYAIATPDNDAVAVPIDGGPIRPLVSTSRSEEGPAWMPAQNAVVYASDRDGEWSIWATDLAGRWEKRLVRGIADPVGNLGLNVSPDGSRIVFLLNRRTLAVAPAGGGTAITLRTAEGDDALHRPDWSSDGQWVIFDSNNDQARTLFKMRAAGNEAPVPLGRVQGGDFRWSPDGKWIAARAGGKLVLIAPDGKDTRALTARSSESAVAWTPDSRALYLMQRIDGQFQLSLVNAADGAGKAIVTYSRDVQFDLSINGMMLSPDGKSLATTQVRLTSDIWIADGLQLTRRWWDRVLPRRPSVRRPGRGEAEEAR